MVEPMKMSFGKQTCVGLKNQDLDGDTFGCHLANKVNDLHLLVMHAVATITVTSC